MPKSLMALCLIACCIAAPALAQNKVRPGLGDDPGVPETSPLQLPDGVELAGPIWGVDAEDGECPGADASFGARHGGVKVCVPLRNLSGGPQTLTLNPGLILIHEFQEGQNGLLVERVRINVPATPSGSGGCRPVAEDARPAQKQCEPENGDPDSVFIVQLNLRCLNENRSPSFPGMRYSVAGVTSDPDLLALATLLATKDLSSDHAEEIATEAIWEITERQGLTPETLREVEALPARQA